MQTGRHVQPPLTNTQSRTGPMLINKYMYAVFSADVSVNCGRLAQFPSPPPPADPLNARSILPHIIFSRSTSVDIGLIIIQLQLNQHGYKCHESSVPIRPVTYKGRTNIPASEHPFITRYMSASTREITIHVTCWPIRIFCHEPFSYCDELLSVLPQAFYLMSLFYCISNQHLLPRASLITLANNSG